MTDSEPLQVNNADARDLGCKKVVISGGTGPSSSEDNRGGSRGGGGGGRNVGRGVRVSENYHT